MLCRLATIMIKRTIIACVDDSLNIVWYTLQGDYSYLMGGIHLNEEGQELHTILNLEDTACSYSFPHHLYVPGTTSVIYVKFICY